MLFGKEQMPVTKLGESDTQKILANNHYQFVWPKL